MKSQKSVWLKISIALCALGFGFARADETTTGTPFPEQEEKAMAAKRTVYYIELDADSTIDGGNTVKNVLYGNLTYKINDRFSFVPEVSTLLYYRQPGPSGNAVTQFDVDHRYLRFLLTDAALAKFGGWTMEMTYRYLAPTTLLMQQQGGLGFVGLRPGIQKKFGRFTAYVRYNAMLYLQRNGYEINPQLKTGVPVAPGNTVFVQYLQLLPSFDISPTVSLVWEIDFFQNFNGPNAHGVKWSPANSGLSKPFTQDFYQDITLSYTSPHIWDLTVAAYIEQYTMDYTSPSGFSYFRRSDTDAGFLIGKTF